MQQTVHRLYRLSTSALVVLPGILLGCILVAAVLQQSGHTNSLQLLRGSYRYSEFLIAYLPGFLRRGLLGELGIRVTAWFSFGPMEVQRSILALCTVSFLALVAFLVARLRRELQSSAGLLVLLLSQPFLFAFPILDGSFVRKDSLNLLIFLVAYSLLEKGVASPCGVSRSSVAQMMAGLALFAVGSLIHESFLFFCLLPALLSLIASGWHRPLGRLGTIGLASIFAVVAVLSTLFHGGPETADLLCHRWFASGLDLHCGSAPPAAFQQLASSVSHALAQTGRYLGSMNGVYWLILLGSCFLVLLRATTLVLGGSRAVQRRRWITLLAIVMCSIPIYALGVDWGRWLYINAVTFLILVSSVDLQIAQPQPGVAFPDAEEAPSENRPPGMVLKGFPLALVLLAMMYKVPGWLQPHVLDLSWVEQAVLPRILRMF